MVAVAPAIVNPLTVVEVAPSPMVVVPIVTADAESALAGIPLNVFAVPDRVRPVMAVAVEPSEIVVEPTVTEGLAMYVLEIAVPCQTPEVMVPTVEIDDEPVAGEAPMFVSTPDALVAPVPPATIGRVPAVKTEAEVEYRALLAAVKPFRPVPPFVVGRIPTRLVMSVVQVLYQ